MPGCQSYGRHSVGSPQGGLALGFLLKEEMEHLVHNDHQTLIFPSSLPRGLVLHMESPHFFEEMIFQVPLLSLELILMQGRWLVTRGGQVRIRDMGLAGV